MLQMRKCDFLFGYNGVDYVLTAEADTFNTDDPQAKHLTRAGAAKNKLGLVYTEGVKDPLVTTVVVVAPSQEYMRMFKQIYDDEERIDFKVIDRKTGERKSLKNAILQKQPRQLALGEGADELNVSLIIEYFEDEDK